MQETLIWLIRHGQTDWNIKRLLQGWRDEPLNELGLSQAQRLAQRLISQDFAQIKPDVIICSDMQRTIKTIEPLAKLLNLPILQHKGLRERNYGRLEGQSWKNINNYSSKSNPTSQQGPIELDFSSTGADSLTMLYERLGNTLEEIACQYEGKKIVLVSHGGSIDMVWRYIQNLPPNTPRPMVQKNTAINLIKKENQIWHILQWADCNHLPEDEFINHK